MGWICVNGHIYVLPLLHYAQIVMFVMEVRKIGVIKEFNDQN